MDTSQLLERLHRLETEIESVKNELEPPKKGRFELYVLRPARFVVKHWAVIFSLSVAIFIYWKYGIGYFEPQKNLALAKRTSDSYVRLADQLMLNGEFPAAKEAYGAALKASPSNVEATRGLLKTDVLQPLTGQQYLIPEVEQTKIEHLELLLNKNDDKGTIEKMVAYLGGSKEEDKSYIVPYFRGQQAEQQYDYQNAKKYYKESTDRNPRFVHGYISLAYINILAGDPVDDAVTTLRAALKQNSGSAIALNNLGYCYLLKLDFQSADCLFQESFRISPYLETYINLGDTYRFMNLPALALAYHKAALDLVENKQNENEKFVSGTMAINFMPLEKDDSATPKHYITVSTFNEKRALVNYEISLDYALSGDLKKADEAFDRASVADTDKQYQAFVKNKIDSLLSIGNAEISKKSASWFAKKKLILPDTDPVLQSPTLCRTLDQIVRGN